MAKIKNRPRHDQPPPQYSSRNHSHNHRSTHKPDHQPRLPPDPYHNRTTHGSPAGKPTIFTSYLDTPNIPFKVKQICEIIANTASVEVDRVLNDTEFIVSTEEVENVLKLSYAHPAAAVKFFRWSAFQLNDSHSPYAWNLVVDMLGKNCLFDAMWDAIKSIKSEGFLSLATFASVFGSYVMAGMVHDAIKAFQLMEHYGCVPDIVALNSLFSAICRDGKTADAKDFLNFVIKGNGSVKPDADSYAILLEGWENENDGVNARRTFDEMVREFGWDPNNFAAYDSFLNLLLKSEGGLKEAMRYFVILKDKSCYPGIRFFKAALNECASKGDVNIAKLLWESMSVQDGCKPGIDLYNLMISLYSYVQDADLAIGMLDEMVFNGVFPDSQSYNILLHFLIKGKKLKEAQSIFSEMIKNEFLPTHENCCLSIRGFVEGWDLHAAIKIWKCMIENYDSDLGETGNILVARLRDFNRLPEAVKYADDMLDRGIYVSSATLSLLRQGLAKSGKGPVYDELLRKWKLHNSL